MRRGLWVWAVLVSVVGCDGSGTLIVQVRTDLLPVAELAAIETTLEPDGAPSRFDANATQDWGRGVRVAEIPVSAGSLRARVRALGPDGSTLVERPLRVEVGAGEVRVVTVLLTRDCAGVICPEGGDPPLANTCVGGRCVEDTCSEEDPEGCAPADCSEDGECPSGPFCTTPTCTLSGVCFLAPDHSACATGEACDVMIGCTPVSPPDDAGVDDAGTTDGGARDAGDGDAGMCVPDVPCMTSRLCEMALTTCPPSGIASCVAVGGPARGTTCRAPLGVCDLEETCDGSSLDCPADAYEPNGMRCATVGRCFEGDCYDCTTECGVSDCTTLLGAPGCLRPSCMPCGVID